MNLRTMQAASPHGQSQQRQVQKSGGHAPLAQDSGCLVTGPDVSRRRATGFTCDHSSWEDYQFLCKQGVNSTSILLGV